MADEQIQIQVNANTGQAQTNINGLDKVINELQKNILELNKSLQDFSNLTKSTSGLDNLSKSVDNVSTSMVKLGNQMKDFSSNKTPEIPLPDNEKVVKTMVGLQGLSSALKLFAGDVGEGIGSVIQMGYALDALALNPVTLTILAIASSLELMKSAYTDTIQGQDNLNAAMDEGKYAGNSYWEQLLNIGSAMKSFYYLITGQTEAYKKNNEELERNNHNLSGLSMNLIGESSLSQANFIRQLGVSNLALKDFSDHTSIAADAISDMDYNVEDVINKLDILKTSQISASVETKKTLTSGIDALKAQANVIEDLIPAAKKLKLIFLSKENGGLVENITKAADIEGFIIENKKTLTNYQVEQLRIFEKISQTALDQQAKLATQNKTRERLLKRNNQVLIQQMGIREKAYLDSEKTMVEADEDRVNNDKDNSEKQHNDKLKLYNDDISSLKKRNKEIEKEKKDQERIDDILGNSQEVRNKAQHILDNQIIQNQHKITLALQKRKKEEEAWRIFNIKNQYAIKEANDVLSIISAKDDEETYKAKVQLAKDEMTEKVKILGLTDQQIANLSDKAQRDEMVKQGVFTGEMVKIYSDYLLKVKSIDDGETRRKEEKIKKEEENKRKLLEFQKAGVKANEDLLKDQATATQDRVDKANEAIREEAAVEIQAVKDRGAKLIEAANGDAATILMIKKSMQDQIDDIDKKSTDKQKDNQQSLYDKKIAQFDSLTSAVDDWNQVLKGSANVSKAIEEGQAVINTLGAANKALNAKYSPEGTTDMVLRIAAVASTLANGYAQVKKISETPSGGGGGGAAGLPSIPTAPNMFALGQGQIQNPTAFAANRVYVTEHDITSTQQRVKTVESGAVLGR